MLDVLSSSDVTSDVAPPVMGVLPPSTMAGSFLRPRARLVRQYSPSLRNLGEIKGSARLLLAVGLSEVCDLLSEPSRGADLVGEGLSFVRILLVAS